MPFQRTTCLEKPGGSFLMLMCLMAIHQPGSNKGVDRLLASIPSPSCPMCMQGMMEPYLDHHVRRPTVEGALSKSTIRVSLFHNQVCIFHSFHMVISHASQCLVCHSPIGLTHHYLVTTTQKCDCPFRSLFVIQTEHTSF